MSNDKKQCRTCLTMDKEKRFIKINRNIVKMITNITSLKISLQDSLSQWICPKCSKDIKKFYKFRNQCLNAAKVLSDSKIIQSFTIIEVKLENQTSGDQKPSKIKLEPYDHHKNEDLLFEDHKDWKPDMDFSSDEGSSSGRSCIKIVFDCPYCHAPFVKMNLFEKHLKLFHPEKDEDPTDLVKDRRPLGYVSTSEAINIFERNKGGSFDYQCACKEFTTSKYSDFLEHLKIHYGDKPIVCNSCDYRCADIHLLKLHILTHSTEKPFKCPNCNYSCKRKSSLHSHLATHSEEKKYQCKECQVAFKYAANISSHKARVHDNKKNFPCEVCGKRFSTSQNLRHHTVVHTGERPHVCEICGMAFSQASNLKKHIMIRHESVEESKKFKCDICNYTSNQKVNLARHMHTHTGVKDYKCDQCDKLFGDPSNLRSHLLRHSGELNFTCDMCNYKCATSSYLKIHRRIHTGERPFPCDICNYSGKTQSALRIHRQTHNTEQNFACPNCPYRTNVAAILRKHIRQQCIVKKRGRTSATDIIDAADKNNVKDEFEKLMNAA